MLLIGTLSNFAVAATLVNLVQDRQLGPEVTGGYHEVRITVRSEFRQTGDVIAEEYSLLAGGAAWNLEITKSKSQNGGPKVGTSEEYLASHEHSHHSVRSIDGSQIKPSEESDELDIKARIAAAIPGNRLATLGNSGRILEKLRAL